MAPRAVAVDAEGIIGELQAMRSDVLAQIEELKGTRQAPASVPEPPTSAVVVATPDEPEVELHPVLQEESVPAPMPDTAIPPREDSQKRRKKASPVCKAIDAFRQRELDLTRRFKQESLPHLAELKALVCLARSLDVQAKASGVEFDLDQALEGLSELLDRAQPEGFFAFNRARSYPHALWQELHDAFAALAVAEEALGWLAGAQVPRPDEGKLLLGCAAAEAWIRRLAMENDLRFTDEQQIRMHRRIEERIDAIQGETSERIYVPWWKNAENGGPTIGEIRAAAAGLDHVLQEYHSRAEKQVVRRAREEAMARLHNAFSSGLVDESISTEELRQAVEACLEAGIAPSDKQLRALLEPYRGYLEAIAHPQGDKLLKYLDKDALSHIAKNERLLEIEEEPDDDTQLEELRSFLKGKTMLFVGGRCEGERKAMLTRQLGLKELIWPGSERTDDPSRFEPYLAKADVVCLLIRFSRHSYKAVLDRAKAEGKQTCVFKAGLGLRRVVSDLHAQLGSRGYLA